MIRTCRGASLIRRAYNHQTRRLLHEDSSTRSGEFLGFSVSNSSVVDPQFGMDMTRAPGYEVAAEDDAPLVGDRKLVDFAVRHARLSSAQVSNAGGYIWVGNVLYPSGMPPAADFAFPWELRHDEESDFDSADVEADPLVEAAPVKEAPQEVPDEKERTPLVEAKRRYSGGQARRIRKQRDRDNAKRAARTSKTKRPVRKPKNDVSLDDDDS